MTSFELWNEEELRALANLSSMISCRPSDLIEWKDDGEWIERLIFDMFVMGKSNANQ